MVDHPSQPQSLPIRRLAEVEADPLAGGALLPALLGGIDAIFQETTSAKFRNEAERAAFRSLWLGQYLERDREHVYLALARDGGVAGYLVGCWDHPARSTRFAALGYFSAFATVADWFPAHLHINVTASARNQGIGAQLVEAFCARSAAAGIGGVHVVTGAEARNIRFYNRLGFIERARTSWNGNAVVFLGRDLKD